jgi:hypothetical protein
MTMLILKMIGLALGITGVILMWFQFRTIASEEITTGKVIELIPVRGNKGRTAYRVKVEFFDAAKARHECISGWSANPAPYDLDEPVRVTYDRGNPEANRLFTFGTRFGTGWIFLGIGLLILWIALGFSYGNAYLETAYPNTF